MQFRVTRHLESFCLVDFFQRNLQSPRNVFGDPINISKKVLWSSERDNRDDKIIAIIKLIISNCNDIITMMVIITNT